MSGSSFSRPTEGELAILQVLWANGPSTVRFINDELNQEVGDGREIGYTTTLKLMQLMLEKHLLARDTSQRTHVYRALISEEETRQRLLDKFVNTTFRGSAMDLVMQALGNHDASQEELAAIKALIQKMEDEQE
ncbi:BlaI/MecI/CopY family transcriptional regulator [Flavilitoribacter nigricans]|uniref:Transcriptional regulator n=1 Tax=Flavilitoribacter nigricans (strain ATCC 23147 / DSM 23189 / NBRC 102662 / NCIMB 1420 / SS-2) TaxID=1122177 RepID=A0A2D0NFJ1_FLAN2|nr:BlaI/MecI/CopY family transcriptional regulator [Flavilitoribacter nigricans]PHN07247.1 transcriptional regulator [Flavilitoribacter nigricans DSM 23189 = NBRC 102662]